MLLPAIVSADYENDTLPVYNLGEVVIVSAERDKPQTGIYQISSNNISLFGQPNSKDALNSIPGLFASYGAKGEARLALRGFQGREVLILMDGRPMNLPYYGELDLNSLPLGNVALVKVVKGPADALYGANTMGGLINLVSQRVNQHSIHQAKFSVGENNSYDARLNFGSAIDRIDYWISLGYSISDGYQLAKDFKPTDLEDGGLRDNSDYRTFNIDAKINYQISDQNLLSFSSGYYDARRGLPTATDWATYQEFPEWKRYYFDLSGQGLFNSALLWRAKLYYDAANNRLKRYNDDSFSDDDLRFNSYHDSYALGARFTLESKINSRLNNISGFTVRTDGIDRQPDAEQPWIFNDILTGSIFSQFHFQPYKKILLDAGVSYNLSDSDQSEFASHSIDPYAKISYYPARPVALYFSISQATRFPTLDHLYNEVSGNPELEPEQALKIETGYQLQINPGLSFRQSCFYNDVTNLIDRPSRNDEFENLFEVTLKGVESGLLYSGKYNLSASIYHTYLDAYDDSNDQRRYHVPRNKYDYNISYRTEFGLTISHSGQYIAGRVAADQSKLPDYFLINARLAFALNSTLSLSLNARNLLDKNYEEERYYPMPGRMVIFGVEYGY